MVFDYDNDAPSSTGIVRVGKLDGDIDALERQSGEFSVTIEGRNDASLASLGDAVSASSAALPRILVTVL